MTTTTSAKPIKATDKQLAFLVQLGYAGNLDAYAPAYDRGYARRRRSRGRRGRLNVGRTDLRMAALIIVAFVAGAIAYRGGFINPLGGLLR